MSEEVMKPGKHLQDAPELSGADNVTSDWLQYTPAETETDAQLELSPEPQVEAIEPRSTREIFTFRNFYKRTKQAALLAVVGAGAAATVTEYSPNPKVSAGGTDALIGVSDFLRDNGETGLIAIAGVTAVIGLARLRSIRVKEMLDSTKPTDSGKERHWSRKILPPLLVTATAVGTGLGAEAGRGANEPINAIVSAMGADRDKTYAIIGNKDALPFNHSAVSIADSEEILGWSTDNAYKATPFYMQLGAANNSDNAANPSSAGIIALPEALLPALDSTEIVAPYGTMEVITTSQFADVGDEITVEGEPAIVVGTTDTYPGLDRTSIVTSIEDLEDSVLAEDEPPFGVMVSGIGSQAEIDAFLKEQGIDASAISVDEWQESYNEFWDRSVTPLSMEFLLLIGGIGSVAAGFMRTSDILRRRRDLANQHVIGVYKESEAKAEYIRTTVDTARATVFAAAPTVGFLALTNSAQYGVALEASPAGLGAGAILVGGSLLLSTITADRMIRKMDSANEVR